MLKSIKILSDLDAGYKTFKKGEMLTGKDAEQLRDKIGAKGFVHLVESGIIEAETDGKVDAVGTRTRSPIPVVEVEGAAKEQIQSQLNDRAEENHDAQSEQQRNRKGRVA